LRSVRTWIVAGVVTALLGLTVVACGDDDSETDPANAFEDGTTGSTLPIDTVVTYQVTERNHVDTEVNYPQTPPVGGNHAPAWQTCAFYDKPIYKEAGTHSLEHGAVWITFKPDIPAAEIEKIRALTEQPETLASPWDEANDGTLPAPIVVSAWGAQVGVNSIDSAAVADFIDTYREAASSPEAGVPCSQGITLTK
jgi:hypothetical protein